LIHVHIWNDNNWDSVVPGNCDLSAIVDDRIEPNYDYSTSTIPGIPDGDRCIPNEVYFTEFIPEYFIINPGDLLSDSYI
jgi:hypothetical protein